MPPMTVVAPSATCTVVLALCVTIGGTPFTSRAKSAKSLPISMRMITVSAVVICGVTARRSAASRKVTVTVLFATVWMGI